MGLKNLLLIPSLWGVIKPKPDNLYKFHKLDRYLEDLLISNSLWASRASDLNDPYDCEIELTKEYVEQQYLSRISLEEIMVDISKVGDETKFRKRLLEYLPQEAIIEMQVHFRTHLRVCCFTNTPFSELMWSHYANAGKGVCLQFKFSDSSFLKKIVAIKYTNRRIKIFTDIDRFKAIFYKRTAWAYEKEWRLAVDEEHIEFNKADLVGIIFGPRTSEIEMESIKNLCLQNDYNVTFSTCKYGKRGLSIENLS